MVVRKFFFGSTPFTYNFRPYIPRISPRDAFYQVIHPDANHANLITENVGYYEFGGYISDWDGSWFAIHDPASQRGIVVVQNSAEDSNGNPIPVQLWVDQDGGSWSDCSSVVLMQPTGGFTGTVTVREKIGFYDSVYNAWTPNLSTLPPSV
jgi:hypothetical protein